MLLSLLGKLQTLQTCHYVLFDCNGYLKKNTIKVLCLSFIDNSNNYIIALEIAYYCY